MDTLLFALKLMAELVPLFVIVSTLVYLAVEKLTPERIRSLLGGRSAWVGVPLAAGLGALTPFCSCSTVPMVNGMKSAGIPTVTLVAFLIASPLVNPVAVALLAGAVGMQYAVLYTAVSLVFAMAAGVVVARWHVGRRARSGATAASACPSCVPSSQARPAPVSGPAAVSGPAVVLEPAAVSGLVAARGPTASSRPRRPATVAACCFGPVQRSLSSADAAGLACCGTVLPLFPVMSLEPLRKAFGRALTDLRKLWIPLVLAIALGAAIHGYVPAALLARVAGPSRWWAIPGAALLGVPVYASIVVLLPIGATLLAKGVGVGAVTAFLMGASGFSLPEGILLSKILPRPLLLRVLLVFALGVVLIGYAFQALLG